MPLLFNYYQVWLDYNQYGVLQHQLTVDSRTAAVILSALTALVQLTTGAFWIIFTYSIFRLIMSKNIIDTRGFELRSTLMNPTNPWTDSQRLFQSGRKYRKHIKIGFWESYWLVISGALVWVSFQAASLCISFVSTSADGKSVVPMLANTCGLWTYESLSLAGVSALSNKLISDSRRAQIWVEKCWIESADPLYCSVLIKNSLDYSSGYATCPWSNDRCVVGQNGAWRMESQWIDSHSDLGINAPSSDRLEAKVINTCSVIDTRDVMMEVPDLSANGSFVFQEFYFGSISQDQNFTFHYSTHTRNDDIGYQISAVDFASGYIQPIPEMTRDDGHLSMLFISAGATVYLGTSSDPLYSTSNIPVFADGPGSELYRPDAYVKVVACHEQVQFRNPVNNQTSTATSINNVFQQGVGGLNEKQLATQGRLRQAIQYSSTYNTVDGLGATALLTNSQTYDLLLPGQPPNAWKAELEYWFKLGLVKVSQYVLDFPRNDNYQSFSTPYSQALSIIDPSPNPSLAAQCHNQLQRNSGGLQTFSLFGIWFTVSVSLFMIICSVLLGDVFRLWDRHANAHRIDVENAYSIGNTRRMVLEAKGYSDWKDADTEVPYREKVEADIKAPIKIGNQLEFPNKNAKMGDDTQVEDGVEATANIEMSRIESEGERGTSEVTEPLLEARGEDVTENTRADDTLQGSRINDQ